VKIWHAFLLILTMIVLMLAPGGAQNSSDAPVPKYDKAMEAVFKGTVDDVRDRHCPVSGGMGSHLMLKQANGSVIEVHLALTKFVNQYELVFHKGDVLEITGVKVKFQGGDTLFARKITRGNDEFLFRDNDGKPLW
jgi:DNA/RNA endonuclease YhcR with UshA esterase domain